MSIRSPRRIENGVKQISGRNPPFAEERGKAATLVMLQPSALCERAHSVDPCTVAALDAIAAFAVPNPGPSSQSQPVFSGLVARSGRPAEQITQPTSDWQI